MSASRRIALRPATRLQQVCFLSEARARPFRPKRVLRQWVTRKRRVRLFDRVTAITAKCCKRCAKCLLLNSKPKPRGKPFVAGGDDRCNVKGRPTRARDGQDGQRVLYRDDEQRGCGANRHGNGRQAGVRACSAGLMCVSHQWFTRTSRVGLVGLLAANAAKCSKRCIKWLTLNGKRSLAASLFPRACPSIRQENAVV